MITKITETNFAMAAIMIRLVFFSQTLLIDLFPRFVRRKTFCWSGLHGRSLNAFGTLLFCFPVLVHQRFAVPRRLICLEAVTNAGNLHNAQKLLFSKHMRI